MEKEIIWNNVGPCSYTVAGYTVYNSHGDIKLSDVTLANLEALADENDDNSEAGGASHSCYKKMEKST